MGRNSFAMDDRWCHEFEGHRNSPMDVTERDFLVPQSLPGAYIYESFGTCRNFDGGGFLCGLVT